MTNKLFTQSSALQKHFKMRLQIQHNGSAFSSWIMLLSFQVNCAAGGSTFILAASRKELMGAQALQTACLAKSYHLQHFHTANLAFFLIWLANLRRHKIRYLHTSQAAFLKSTCYVSSFSVLASRWRTHSKLCHFITAVVTLSYRCTEYLSRFENHCREWTLSTLWPLWTVGTCGRRQQKCVSNAKCVWVTWTMLQQFLFNHSGQ